MLYIVISGFESGHTRDNDIILYSVLDPSKSLYNNMYKLYTYIM